MTGTLGNGTVWAALNEPSHILAMFGHQKRSLSSERVALALGGQYQVKYVMSE